MQDFNKVFEYDKIMETRKWIKEIPFISFPANWQVKIIPPFAGASVRFLVKKDETKDVSIYLDCYGNLGAMDTPYWEVYPHEGGVFRCDMNNTEALLKAISESLSNDE